MTCYKTPSLPSTADSNLTAVYALKSIVMYTLSTTVKNTVNSRLADTLLLRTLAITDKIQIPIYRSLTENDFWHY